MPLIEANATLNGASDVNAKSGLRISLKANIRREHVDPRITPPASDIIMLRPMTSKEK